MENYVEYLKRRANYLASRYQLPAFYSRFYHHHARVRHIFFSDPLVCIIREYVEKELDEARLMGHGLDHSRKVSWDCGALISIEFSGFLNNRDSRRLIILGIIAGLFHDICRLEDNHAELGAQKAARVLRDFPVSQEEIEIISRAIRNHEAFVKPVPCGSPVAQVISDCLYDADKFRWGVDTFTHTLWQMVSYKNLSIRDLIDRFPWGLDGIRKIQNTFRTQTGRLFGPEIIEQGLMLGKELYRILLELGGDNSE